MSARNLILLIIILAILTGAGFLFFYFNKPAGLDDGPSYGEDGTNFFSDFLNFAGSGSKDSVDQETNNSDNEDNEVDDEPAPISEKDRLSLTKISSMPVSGYGIFLKERFVDVPVVTPKEGEVVEPKEKPTAPNTEFVPALRYVDKSTGNIYQTFTDKINERKFSTTIVKWVEESFFGNKGESVIMRYAKTDGMTIATFAGSLPKEVLGADRSEENKINGTFLAENIIDLSVSPDASRVFYLLKTKDSVVGMTSGLMGESKTQVFSSAFSEWLSQWVNNKMITLTTKASSNVAGYMYAIDPTKKEFTRVFGGINGLTTLTSPSGELVLYSGSNMQLAIYNTKTREHTQLQVRTLPEKCVWNSSSTLIYCMVPKFIPNNIYPDSWYQGEVSFSDEIWEIDSSLGSASFVVDPLNIEFGEEIDGIKLGITNDGKELFFINKKDLHLWGAVLN